MLRRTLFATALVGSSLAVVAAPASAASTFSVWNLFASASLAEVPVDVCVGGELVIDNLRRTGVTGPFDAPADQIELTVFNDSADEDCDREEAPLIEDSTAVVDGGILVLHSGANGVGGAEPVYAWLPAPACVAAGSGRATLLHAANAPAVDVAVGGDTIVEDLANGQARSLDVPGGTALDDIDITVAGTDTTVLSASGVGTVDAGTELIVAVIGGNGPSQETRTIGADLEERPLSVCQVSTSSTTSSTTTTTTGTGPVTATPRFTG